VVEALERLTQAIERTEPIERSETEAVDGGD
jgi:hypothetical protein